jgi:hypothetical protein
MITDRKRGIANDTGFNSPFLKLTAGDIDALHNHLEMARCDYRDVLAFADYFSKIPPNAKYSDPAHAE